jgi:hypothetical protein
MNNFNPKDARYIKEYKAWFDKLPKKQRELMKQQGLDKPSIDVYSTHQPFDVSELQMADTSLPYDETLDEKIYTEAQMGEMLCRVLEKIVHEIMSKKNPYLSATCMLYILGQSEFKSEQEIAEKLHMTRANVSARCIELKDKFGIENSLIGRGIHARKSYQRSVKGVLKRDESLFENFKMKRSESN